MLRGARDPHEVPGDRAGGAGPVGAEVQFLSPTIYMRASPEPSAAFPRACVCCTDRKQCLTLLCMTNRLSLAPANPPPPLSPAVRKQGQGTKRDFPSVCTQTRLEFHTSLVPLGTRLRLWDSVSHCLPFSQIQW